MNTKWPTNESLRDVIRQCTSKSAVLRTLGYTTYNKDTNRYYEQSYARSRLNKFIQTERVDISHFDVNTKITRWDKLSQMVVDECTSFTDILIFLDIPNVGSNHRILKDKLNSKNLDYSHITLRKTNRRSKRKVCNDELFCKHTNKNRNAVVRQRVIEQSLIPYKCGGCGMDPIWNEQPITLQMDHINGDNTDNSLTNLRFLCPNCHSQTDTWGGRNISVRNVSNVTLIEQIPPKQLLANILLFDNMKSLLKMYSLTQSINNVKFVKSFMEQHDIQFKPPQYTSIECSHFTKQELQNILWVKPQTSIGKQFGISGNAIKRYVQRWQLETPPRGYFLRTNQ